MSHLDILIDDPYDQEGAEVARASVLREFRALIPPISISEIVVIMSKPHSEEK